MHSINDTLLPAIPHTYGGAFAALAGLLVIVSLLQVQLNPDELTSRPI